MRGNVQLQRLAFHDTLTGLANRALLYERIRQAAAAARRTGGGFAVLLIDLDRFSRSMTPMGIRPAISFCARPLAGCNPLRAKSTPRPASEETSSSCCSPRLRIARRRSWLPAGSSRPSRRRSTSMDYVWASASASPCFPMTGPMRINLSRAPTARWTTPQVISIERVDKQHVGLYSQMNGRCEELRAGRDRGMLSRRLTAMTCHLKEHFAIEEAYMAANPRAPFVAHRLEHQRVVEMARNLGAHVDDRGLELGIRFLHDWMTRHIRSYDAVR